MNCDEIRPVLRQRLLEDSKIAQMAQIEDKKREVECQKHEDLMWHQVADRMNRRQLARELLEGHDRSARKVLMARELNDQMGAQVSIKRDQDEERREDLRRNELKLLELADLERKVTLDEFEKRKHLAAQLKVTHSEFE